MTDRYLLIPATDGADWDAFVRASPHGSVYASSACIAHLLERPTLYYCLHGEERVAAVVLPPPRPPGTDAAQSDLLVYSGILGAPMPAPPNDARSVLEYFRTTEFIIGELARRHECLQIQLSPSYVDIRPFLWHNHGTDDPKFLVDVRYTSYLDITDCVEDEESALGRARTLRRREVRRARSLGMVTTEEFDPDLCAELCRLTLARQRIDRPPHLLGEMKAVMRGLHAAGAGRMFVTRNAAGVAASALFMGIDARRAYFMFGGSDPAMRDEPGGTLVFWDAFRAMRRAGVVEVDLEGVNSPRRGWFKLSFGGALLPYFALSLDQRAAHA